MNPQQIEARNPATPWWKVGMVWLVLSGPAAVVLAGFVTLKIALTHVDPVIPEPPVAAQVKDPSLMPAVKARNHAAEARP